MTRKQRTLQELRARRAMGHTRRPRKRLPKQIPPRGVERRYTQALFDYVKALREAFQPVFDTLPQWVKRNAERFDAESQDASALIDEITKAFEAQFATAQLEDLAERFARETATWQRLQFVKQVRAALGIELPMSDSVLADAIADFTTENVALIKNIPRKTAFEIEGLIHRSLPQGRSYRDIAKDLEQLFGFAKGRAKLIAVDQVGKFYGTVHKIRQTGMGIEKYAWRTVNDIRVRTDHSEREGEIFEWSNPPFDGHPGQPIRCRCYPEPVFDDILDEI